MKPRKLPHHAQNRFKQFIQSRSELKLFDFLNYCFIEIALNQLI